MKITYAKADGTNVEVEATAEYVAQNEQEVQWYQNKIAEEQADREAKDNLKASAKAKLIAGEPLTEEEANTIVL